MGEIRVFTEEHLPSVAALYWRIMRGRRGEPAPAVASYFREIFLASPWTTPDIPSLAYFDQARLVGFLGVIPRPMTFLGKPVRAAITTQFMVDRDNYRGMAALEMLRRLFQGPQDLCYSDGAAEESHIVWRAAGGQAARLYSMHWFRALRPLRTAASVVARRGSSWRWVQQAVRPADALLSHVPLGALRPPPPGGPAKLAQPSELLPIIEQSFRRDPLHPAYDPESFSWLMHQAAAARALGDLRAMVVHNPKGEPCGAFAYFARPFDTGYVLHISATRRDYFDTVLATLFHDAWHQEVAIVKGQLIPQYMVNFTAQHCLFRSPSHCTLIHSAKPDLLRVVHQGDAALSRLDGEAWLRFSSEPWQ